MIFKALKSFASSDGVNFLLAKLPEKARNFIIKTGAVKKDILERLLSNQITTDDINYLSQNTLVQLKPGVAEALKFMSKEVGEPVNFIFSIVDNEVVVSIQKDNENSKAEIIPGSSFPFEYLLTAILSKYNQAKLESSLLNEAQSANNEEQLLIADKNEKAE